MPTQQRTIQPDDLFKLHFLQAAALSPHGDQFVYALSTYDADDDADYNHIWLQNIATGAARQLTHGKHSNTNPQWSPDGKTLAFISTRKSTEDEKPQLYLLPVDGGEARKLTNLKQGVAGGPAWSPDGAQIAFTAGPVYDEEPDPTDPYRVTRSVYRFDAIGYLDQAVQDIYLIATDDADGKGEPQQLTRDATHNTNPQWSPDGQQLLYAASMQPDSLQPFFPELCVVNLTGETRTLVNKAWGAASASAAWLPDSQHVAFIGTPDGKLIGSKSDLYVADLAGGEPVNRTASHDVGIGGRLQPDMPAGIIFQPGKILVTQDGEAAYVQVQRGGGGEIVRVALMGPEQHEVILDGERSCLPLALRADERSILFAATSINAPPDLALADSEGGNEQQLTRINGALLGERRDARVEQITFPSKDGVEVEGWMIMPADGDGPFPTILYIHGGPHGAFGHMYHFDTQMLVGAGFGVLMVNHRASTGYGDAFATAIKGDWGNLDYADLMAGVDAAIARGWADPDRLGVCGLSGGGNLSSWIVGQTERFKAAVPENPLTNWLSFYGTSDVGVLFALEELGGHPHEIPEVYTRCSPITYAHRCTTPTLLVQCENDYRCPAEQSEQFYNVLKANGCPVEMLRLPGGSHAGAIAGPPKVRRAQNEALVGWMTRWVLG